VLRHFARLVVDVDLSKPLHDYVVVEMEGFTLHVGVVFKKHSEFCNNYQTLGDHIYIYIHCNKLN